MNIKILFFGIIRDLIGKNSLEFKMDDNTTILNLKESLLKEYDKLNDFSNFSIAVNEKYVETNYILKNNDVVALIPPVSGG